MYDVFKDNVMCSMYEICNFNKREKKVDLNTSWSGLKLTWFDIKCTLYNNLSLSSVKMCQFRLVNT